MHSDRKKFQFILIHSLNGLISQKDAFLRKILDKNDKI